MARALLAFALLGLVLCMSPVHAGDDDRRDRRDGEGTAGFGGRNPFSCRERGFVSIENDGEDVIRAMTLGAAVDWAICRWLENDPRYEGIDCGGPGGLPIFEIIKKEATGEIGEIGFNPIVPGSVETSLCMGPATNGFGVIAEPINTIGGNRKMLDLGSVEPGPPGVFEMRGVASGEISDNKFLSASGFGGGSKKRRFRNVPWCLVVDTYNGDTRPCANGIAV